MKIGEKIKELRVAKLMTQAELCGGQITRNMLSCIETGSAQPSLQTLIYLASRLNIPAGFLLAEEGDEAVYRKMNAMSNIKSAYREGDFWNCRRLCLAACPQPDDEIALILAKCDLEIGEEEFSGGRLHSACRFFDESLEYAKKTAYPFAEGLPKVRTYFSYMSRISPTLFSEAPDEEENGEYEWNCEFAFYVQALSCLENGDEEGFAKQREMLSEHSFYAKHVTLLAMVNGQEYREGRAYAEELLKSGSVKSPVQIYELVLQLEICCRESEDFKGAYFYANEKVRLAEELLREDAFQNI